MFFCGGSGDDGVYDGYWNDDDNRGADDDHHDNNDNKSCDYDDIDDCDTGDDDNDDDDGCDYDNDDEETPVTPTMEMNLNNFFLFIIPTKIFLFRIKMSPADRRTDDVHDVEGDYVILCEDGTLADTESTKEKKKRYKKRVSDTVIIIIYVFLFFLCFVILLLLLFWFTPWTSHALCNWKLFFVERVQPSFMVPL